MKKIKTFELKFENLEAEVMTEISGKKQERNLPQKWIKLYDELIYSKMKKERFAENYIKLMMLRNLMVENLK